MADPEDQIPDNAPGTSFSWVFFAFMLVSTFLSLFFLFYFNRLFAYIVSLLLRTFLKATGNPRYINIKYIQISPLAGRIFFGNLTYHGPNETITCVSGHITWRYWLRRVRQPGDGDRPETAVGGKGEVPCRMMVEAKGLEWFIYNRSAAYDAIWERLNPKTPDARPPSSEAGGEFEKETGETGSTTLLPEHPGTVNANTYTPPNFEELLEESVYLKMLPIKIDLGKSAVVLGNSTTPSVLIAQMQAASGTIDAKKSLSVDLYQQVYDFNITKLHIEMRPNTEFKTSLHSLGQQQTPIPSLTKSKRYASGLQSVRRVLNHLSISRRHSAQSSAPNAPQKKPDIQWIGLRRYLSDNHSGISDQREYAEDRDLLTSDLATFQMYWDVPGPVPPQPNSISIDQNNINGPIHSPPEWGIYISLSNVDSISSIHYGPWSDRQRVHLQNMFAPKLYRASTPAEALKPGMTRQYTDMKLVIDFLSDTTLRIPIREPSKDWRYRRELEEAEIRPPGWIDMKISSNSSANYNMALVPRPTGWPASLNLDLRNPIITSSVNNKPLLTSSLITLTADLSSPLRWSDDTHWTFNVSTHDMQLFLLREHIILFTDLTADFTAGPPAEYDTFTPMVYSLNLNLHQTEVFLNVNDQNIINNASSLDDNTFLIIRHLSSTSHLAAKVLLDFREFRAKSSNISFSLSTTSPHTLSPEPDDRRVELAISTPPWNTWHTTLTNFTLARLNSINLEGSYDINTHTSPELIDTLILTITASGLDLTLQGLLIRYALIVRENYFGDHMHFRTLEEWASEEMARQHPPPHPSQQKKLQLEDTKTNDIDVELYISVRDVTVKVPSHISGMGDTVGLELADLGVDLRFTNYYMDLQVDISPITTGLIGATSEPQLFIDGVKLYGHRLFGLPPTEPTYICNWDFNVGEISGECQPVFLAALIRTGGVLGFGFKDVENKLEGEPEETIYDVTLLRLAIAGIKVWIHPPPPDDKEEGKLVLLETGEVKLGLNDLSDAVKGERIEVLIPGLKLGVVEPPQPGARDNEKARVEAWVETEIEVGVLGRGKGEGERRKFQQAHIRGSDRRTGRGRGFLQPDYEPTLHEDHELEGEEEQVETSIPVPEMPPVLCRGMEFHRGRLIRQRSHPNLSSSTRTPTKSSSSSSSAASFIIRPRTPHPSSHSRRAPSFRSALTVDSTAGDSVIRHRPLSSQYANSFYSAVESVSDLPLPVEKKKNLEREAVGIVKPPGKRVGGYARPRWGMDGIELDLSCIPSLDSRAVVGGQPGKSTEPQDRVELFSTDENEVREVKKDSIIFQLKPGVRAYLTVTGITVLSNLLDLVSAKTADDVLDELQMKVIEGLSKAVKAVPKISRILEGTVEIPQFNIWLANPKHNDMITLQLLDLTIAGRRKKIIGDVAIPVGAGKRGTKTSLSAHVILGAAHTTITSLNPDRTGPTTAAAASAGVEDFLYYLSSTPSGAAFGTSTTTSTSLSLRTLAFSLLSKELPDLVGSLSRWASFAETFATALNIRERQSKAFIRRVITELASQGEDRRIVDPTCLTRPAEVLRVKGGGNVRLKDEWKVNARLRGVLGSLDPLHPTSSHEAAHASPQAQKARFVDVLKRWRGWELGDLESSGLVRRVYGGGKKKKTSRIGPWGGRCEVGLMKGVIDPGVGTEQWIEIGGVWSVGCGGGKDMAVVEAGVGDVKVMVVWGILRVVEYALQAVNSFPKSSPTIPAANEPGKVKVKSGELFPGVHIIAKLDRMEIKLITPSVVSTSTLTGLTVSGVICGSNTTSAPPSSPTSPTTPATPFSPFSPASATTVIVNSPTPPHPSSPRISSLLLHFNEFTSTLHSTATVRLLTSFIISSPTIYVHQNSHTLLTGPNTEGTEFCIWKLATTISSIEARIVEDVTGLIDIINSMVSREAVDLVGLTKRIQPVPSTAPRPGDLVIKTNIKPEKRTVHMLQSTLDVENVVLGAKILDTLSYEARTNGIQANAEVGGDWRIEVEVAGSEYSLGKEPIRLPRVGIKAVGSQAGKEWEVGMEVEEVEMEAAKVVGMLSALAEDEVTRVLTDVGEEVGRISRSLNKILENPQQPQPSPSKITKKPQDRGPGLVYAFALQVKGVRIHAFAPSADLTLSLSTVHASLSSSAGSIIPSAVLELGAITLLLTRVTEKNPKEVCGKVEVGMKITFTPSSSPSPLTSVPDPDSATTTNSAGKPTLSFEISKYEITLYADTASTVVAVVGHLRDRGREVGAPVVTVGRKRGMTLLKKQKQLQRKEEVQNNGDKVESTTASGFDMAVRLEIRGVRIAWIVGGGNKDLQLALSIQRVGFATSTLRDADAKLGIEGFLLQIADGDVVGGRSQTSALLPKVEFNVTYRVTGQERRVALLARGKKVDVRVSTSCVKAGERVRESVLAARRGFLREQEVWEKQQPPTTPVPGKEKEKKKGVFTSKRLASVIVDADFAGAEMRFFGGEEGYEMFNEGAAEGEDMKTILKSPGLAFKLEYIDTGSVEIDPILFAEVKISASDNKLHPNVVPLVMEMADGIKDVMKSAQADTDAASSSPPPTRTAVSRTTSRLDALEHNAETFAASDTAAILGRCRLNLGFRILPQKFSLSCQPLERVAATASFKQIYITINTCDEPDHSVSSNKRFYASSATVTGFEVECKHIYSRDAVGSLTVEKTVLSVMNSRHVTKKGSQGLSCCLKMGEVVVKVSVGQWRDWLVFREIWTPAPSPSSTTPPKPESGGYSYDGLAQRYHEVSATGAFPSNTTVVVEEVKVMVDWGLKIGNSELVVRRLWAVSRKTSDWEQRMDLGVEEVTVMQNGRVGGRVVAEGLRAGSEIAWEEPEQSEPSSDPERRKGDQKDGDSKDADTRPQSEDGKVLRAPRIKANLGFGKLELKVAFEQEYFMLADLGRLEFVMRNEREEGEGKGDKLVATIEGDRIHFFCTAVTMARSQAVMELFKTMVEEKEAQFKGALEGIRGRLKKREEIRARETTQVQQITSPVATKIAETVVEKGDVREGSDFLSLHTDVSITLSQIFIGVFPSTLFDTRIFRIESTSLTSRFAREVMVAVTDDIDDTNQNHRIHSVLEFTLHDLSIEVPNIKQSGRLNSNPQHPPSRMGEVDMKDVVEASRKARGAPVLKVPRHWVGMETWNAGEGEEEVGGGGGGVGEVVGGAGKKKVEVEVKFGNRFEGMVTIGWDFSRIGFVKLLYNIHRNAMEKLERGDLGSYSSSLLELPDAIDSASDSETGNKDVKGKGKGKNDQKLPNLPVVKVPQGKYVYVGKQVEVQTPQLRDMGEATPSLEWLGLNMERLPQVTHQYVVVTLLEVARKVEDRYWKILGS